MDYISEAERLKLYYKGLNEAGSSKHIATAHPDLVSDKDELDTDPALLENDDLYLKILLPLYYKLAYVYNNRFIHEDISLYNPAPQRVLTAKEIYDVRQSYTVITYTVSQCTR